MSKRNNNSSTKAIIGLAAATVVVIGASVAISLTGKGSEVSNPNSPTPTVAGGTQGGSETNNNNTENKGTTLDLAGAGEKIEAAYLNEDGTYTVVVNENGYVGAMKIEITYAADGQTILGYNVLESSETPGIGSKVDEDEYKTLLAGVTLPIYANGMDISAILGAPAEETVSAVGELQDGVYEAVSEPASNGYVAHVTMTVEGGRIVAVTWDEEKDGSWKSVLSTKTPYDAASYIMRPLWHQQSEKMCKLVIDNQGTAVLDGQLGEDGKFLTADVVSGVSIQVAQFKSLVDRAIAEAAGKDGEYTVKDEMAYGYAAQVTLTVKDGKLAELVWDEVDENGNWKSDLSVNGQYVMAPVWDTQAKDMSQYVVDHQGTAGLNLNDNGKTDVVSGVSINVAGFTALVDECIAKASGAMNDGVYEVVGAPASNGYVAHVTVTVEGGRIVAVTWDEEKDGSWKSVLSTKTPYDAASYIMRPLWHQQSEKMCKLVIDNQGTAVLDGQLGEDGKFLTADVVSGVSIQVAQFKSLVDRAIAEAAGKDGEYTVKDEMAYGYAAQVTLTVKDGKLADLVWDEVDENGNWKSDLSVNGQYVMAPVWDTQAKQMAQYVVDTQGTSGLGINEAGKPTSDAVAGVSINVEGFLGLVDQAVAQAKGSYEDGVYEVAADPDEKGNYPFVTLTIENGKITNVTWDEHYNGSLKSVLSTQTPYGAGSYIMRPLWHQQSEKMCKLVIDNQGTAVLDGQLGEDGKFLTADVVSGVSIQVAQFKSLVDRAIAEAAGKDGEYTVKDEMAYGYAAQVTLTVKDGKLAELVWDEVDENGNWKSDLSVNGQYVMAPVWDTQAKDMGQYVVDHQGTAGLNLNDNGKTDVVSGVSINVAGFVDLVNKALAEASTTGEVIGQPEAPAVEGGTLVDVIGGATFSSKAVIRAINEGFVFLRDCVIK